MFFRRVPNNFYTLPSSLLRVFILILLVLCGFQAAYFSPETSFPLKEEELSISDIFLTINGKEYLAGTNYKPLVQENENDRCNIVLISPILHEVKPKYIRTFTRYLLSEGYALNELTCVSEEKKILKPIFEVKSDLHIVYNILEHIVFPKRSKEKSLYPLSSLESSFSFEDIFSAFLKNQKNKIYAVAEGYYAKELYNFYLKNPAAFKGVFLIVDENDEILFNKNNDFYVFYEKSIKFSKDLSQFPVSVLVQNKNKLTGWIDIRSNDILAAILLGSSKDINRKDRIEAAKTCEKWLTLKSN